MPKKIDSNALALKEIDFKLRSLKGYYFGRGNEPMCALLAEAHDRIYMLRLMHRRQRQLAKKTHEAKKKEKGLRLAFSGRRHG